MKKCLIFLILFCALAGLRAQDVIYMKDGKEINAKVLEIGVAEVKYKLFSNPEGPTYTIFKSDIFMIKYPGGERDVFGIPEPEPGRAAHMTAFSEEDICETAISDANANYKPTGAMAGTYVTSCLAMPVGLVTALIVAPSPPKVENLNIRDPNLLQNEAYMNCYLQESKTIKKKRTWLSFWSGWAAGMAIVSIVMLTSY